MKDSLQVRLEIICITQLWVKKQIQKPIEKVDKINTSTIAGIKQRLK